jgi:hypothetical protein
METTLPLTGRKNLKRICYSAAGALLFGTLLIVVAFADALGVFHEPPLRLEQSSSTVVVHVERLGEYFCPVGRIRIQESDSGKTVFESVAKGTAPAIFNFKLIAGSNPTQINSWFSDSYSVLRPGSDASFWLQRGVRYRITVWGDSWTFRRASFVL